MEIVGKTELGNRLNCLLVMPRIASYPGAGYRMPLGIAYISSSLKQTGFNVFTLNLNHHWDDIRVTLMTWIKMNNIEVVMTGGLSAQYNAIKPILEIAKNFSKDMVTIVGGGIVTAEPDVAMDALEFADYGVIGEGELTIVELCTVLEQGGDLPGVSGLIYKRGQEDSAVGEGQGGRYQITAPRQEIQDLDDLPWPDYDGFEFEQDLSISFSGDVANGRNILSMIASRSCPYNCTFCFHTAGRRYRQRSLDSIFKELDYLLAKYKIEIVLMNDELFARDVKRLREFCERIKQRGIKWYSSFRVDDMTEETIEIIKNSNCVVATFGLESADDRILKSMRKGIKLTQIEKTLELTSKAQLPIIGSFILGDLEETLETANKTLDWWSQHPEYNTNISLVPIVSYPGTRLYKFACEMGIIKDRIQFLKDGCPPVNVSKMTDDELAFIKKKAIDLSITNSKEITSSEFYVKGNVVDITGVCKVCGEKNEWKAIRLFSGLSTVACSKCNQTYRPPLDAHTRATIDKNMQKLLKNYKKIAMWGMVYHAVEILCNSEVMTSSRIYAVDLSKTAMDLNGRHVFGPEIIEQQQIDLVIITALNHVAVIESQVRENYKGVNKVISVMSLLGDGSDLD